MINALAAGEADEGGGRRGRGRAGKEIGGSGVHGAEHKQGPDQSAKLPRRLVACVVDISKKFILN